MAKKVTKVFKRLIHGYLPYILTSIFNPHSEKMVYYRYIVNNGDAHHLFLFAQEYKDFDAKVFNDEKCNLPYVIMPESNKRLYFKRGFSSQKIKGMFKALTMEQDYRSPHRYFDKIEELKGKVLLDIGAAEGILSLMAIEQVDHVYLFECETEWIEALQITFKPWENKVTIIPKYVSDHDDDTTIMLDTLFQDKVHNKLFVKMDIEGMERKALAGACKLFSEYGNIFFSICTYHERDDFQVISAFLDKYHCQYKNQTGYWSHRLKSVMLRGHN